jgi:hypothetical protein
VQKSTHVPGSFGSHSDAGSESGSPGGEVEVGPRPSQYTQPSGRSTQRTSRPSSGVWDALGVARSPLDRRHATPLASDTTASASTAARHACLFARWIEFALPVTAGSV